MTQPVIWHNPKCSKSRQTLELIRDKGFEPEIRKYLEQSPTADEIREVLRLSGLSARELMRKGEDDFKALNLADTSLSDEQLIDAMVSHPRLIERPLVIYKGRARLGRPPEQVLELL